jgi:hypothetical protein
VLRAPCSSRWHAAESRPGKSARAAVGRQVRSTSNFGTEFEAITICEAVIMIANSGMILLHMHAHLQEELWCALSCSDHILAGQPTHE